MCYNTRMNMELNNITPVSIAQFAAEYSASLDAVVHAQDALAKAFYYVEQAQAKLATANRLLPLNDGVVGTLLKVRHRYTDNQLKDAVDVVRRAASYVYEVRISTENRSLRAKSEEVQQ